MAGNISTDSEISKIILLDQWSEWNRQTDGSYQYYSPLDRQLHNKTRTVDQYLNHSAE